MPKGKYTITDAHGYKAMQEARKQGEKNLSMKPRPQKVTDGLEKMLQKVNDYARH
jgi:hypothetical protein